ncbi:MAG TPA: hypothetical protein G4N91_04345 [Dehalococcoidia bacterium]|nr:hypothetical protein [Dehalococcoidia bacterium]
MSLAQLMDLYGVALIAIAFTLAALGFSIFNTVYSSLVHNAEMAEGNSLQSNTMTRSYWRKAMNNFRELARSRAYSANLCYLSLLSIATTLILYLISAPNFSGTVINWFCVGTFLLALVLLGSALVFATFLIGYRKAIKPQSKEHGFLLRLLRKFFWPVYADVKGLTEDC